MLARLRIVSSPLRITRGIHMGIGHTLEEIGVRHHPDLVEDWARINRLIRHRQEAFHRRKYNYRAFQEYIQTYEDLGLETEVLKVIDSLNLLQKFLFSGRILFQKGKMTQIEEKLRADKTLIQFLKQMLFLSLFTLLFAVKNDVSGGVIEDGMESMIAKMLSGDEIEPVKKTNTRFEDIIGIDEYRAEVEELVDFLKDPDRYKKAGAKMPKGVLFHGKPGTGKTELARAVANEAGCTFYYQSAAEFMDSIVGQGVTKIQNLFAKARENSPAIIFLDEIDSLASDRSLSMSRYNSMELNQILTEMDGFTPDDKVIVIAATNMIESLDKAILRAGRFDKKIDIPLPDKASRVKLFQFFSKKIKVKGHIDFDTLAKRTTGMTGADIKNMTNLAILHSIKMNRNEATQEDFEYAFDRMVMGVYRKNLTMDEQTKKMTAYHEAGHTLMNLLTQSGMGLHKVTILPVGQSLGHTALTPAIENNQFTSSNLTSMLDVAMGGRIAEELIFGHQDLSTGCSQDLKQASKIANELVRNMGYSSLKTIVLSGETKNMSEVTNEQSDAEVERLLRASLERTKQVLTKNRPMLEKLAKALLAKETMSVAEIRKLLKLPN